MIIEKRNEKSWIHCVTSIFVKCYKSNNVVHESYHSVNYVNNEYVEYFSMCIICDKIEIYPREWYGGACIKVDFEVQDPPIDIIPLQRKITELDASNNQK